MNEKLNPYKYLGPLDSKKNHLVCPKRNDDVNLVISGIQRGEYWTVLGPKQIGKTTFLRLIEKKLKYAYYIYFNFQKPPATEKKVYQSIIDALIENIPHEGGKIEKLEDDDSALSFIQFLKTFQPKNEKKIILMFDEIDGLPSLISFLKTWRQIFTDRFNKKELNRYAVIITGSVDLTKLNLGPNSPFNMANTIYLKDLSYKDSAQLVDKPFARLNITIEPEAKKMLLSQISGHPQLLQHACHILVGNVETKNKEITKDNVIKTINRLLSENTSLKTLRGNIQNSDTLKNLVIDIINGKDRVFHPYVEFSLLGAGAIKEEIKEGISICQIRNEVYRRFIDGILKRIKEVTSPEIDIIIKPEENILHSKFKKILSLGKKLFIDNIFTIAGYLISVVVAVVGWILLKIDIITTLIVLFGLILSIVLVTLILKRRKSKKTGKKQKNEPGGQRN